VNGETLEKMADLAADVLRLQAEVRDREREIAHKKDRAEALLAKHGLNNVVAGAYRWDFVPGERRTIKMADAERLLPPKTLEKLVSVTSYRSLRVGEVNGGQ